MNSQKIVIIDYGVGNTHSVLHAIKELGYYKLAISDNEQVIRSADALILPGVGAFDEAMKNLCARNLKEILDEVVLVKKTPILGICLGMQLLASSSEENGFFKGLNWIDGHVKALDLPKGFSVPHVGWNNVEFKNDSTLFARNDNSNHFYFDHSYWFDCDNKHISAWCEYGIRITAAVNKGNIFGVQFHPEKSQMSGLKLFRSFFNHNK